MPELGRINVFYSYAHKDETYRERLVEWLTTLRDEGVINDWHDRKIMPGSDWSHEIAHNLERSHVVLFLISPAFMRSDYSIGVEVKRAIELHWERRCRIVPVMLEPTPEFTKTEYGTFQALPKNAKPISQWPHPEAAYADIAEGIRRVCKEIVDWENPYRRAAIGDWTKSEGITFAGGRRITFQTRIQVVAKDRNTLIVHSVGSGDGQQIEKRISIPVDRPLEDNTQNLLGQFGERIPANALFWREETGRGEEKLFVGGTPYYCSWSGARVTVDTGNERVTADNKVWRCIDVPLDGIVKSESVIQLQGAADRVQTTILLTAFGRA